MDSPPTPFQKSICWAALSGLSLLVVVALIVALIFSLGWLFVALEAVLLPLLIAGILAYLLHPAVLWVQKKVKRRVLSVLIVLGVAMLGVLGIVATIIPPLVSQTGQMVEQRQQIYDKAVGSVHKALEMPLAQDALDFFYDKLPEKEAAGTELALEPAAEPSYAQKLKDVLDHHSAYLSAQLINWLTSGTLALLGMLSLLIGAAMVPVFLFYFLLESESISRNWHTIIPLPRSRFRTELVATLKEINGYIISFVRGQMLVSVIDGVIIGIALAILGLPYAITIAACVALLGIIPYIGMIVTSVPAMIIAWFTWQDPMMVLSVAAIFVVVNQFDGWVIQPRIVGNSVGMHDMTIMFSVIFWGIAFGGVVGALIAVPLTAALKVIFSRYVWPSLKNRAATQ